MKHCEFCGINSNDYFYRFIAEVQYIIFLNNSRVVKNITTDRYVLLDDGSRLDYSVQTDSYHAVNFEDLISHILCSEQCEDRFLKKYVQYFSNDIYKKHTFINYEKEGLFSPICFPVDSFEHNKAVCKFCNSQFPDFNKFYEINNIVDFRKLDGGLAKEKLLNNMPKLEPHEIMTSNISKENTEGFYFIYKTGLEKDKFQFCSNECCFEYCLKSNSIAFIKTNIEKGYKLMISSDTIDINIALMSVYRYKPLQYWMFN